MIFTKLTFSILLRVRYKYYLVLVSKYFKQFWENSEIFYTFYDFHLSVISDLSCFLLDGSQTLYWILNRHTSPSLGSAFKTLTVIAHISWHTLGPEYLPVLKHKLQTHTFPAAGTVSLLPPYWCFSIQPNHTCSLVRPIRRHRQVGL